VVGLFLKIALFTVGPRLVLATRTYYKGQIRINLRSCNFGAPGRPCTRLEMAYQPHGQRTAHHPRCPPKKMRRHLVKYEQNSDALCRALEELFFFSGT
jgi:hypothetical protein